MSDFEPIVVEKTRACGPTEFHGQTMREMLANAERVAAFKTAQERVRRGRPAPPTASDLRAWRARSFVERVLFDLSEPWWRRPLGETPAFVLAPQ